MIKRFFYEITTRKECYIKIQTMNKILISGFLLLMLSVFKVDAGTPDTLSFIHVSDLHFCNLTGYHPVFVAMRQHYGNGSEPILKFFKSGPGRLSSDFLVITGDMIDYYEAETASGDMLDTEIEQFIKYLDFCDVPVYLTLGNHDISSYFVKTGAKTYTSHMFNAGKARAVWIRNTACFRNGTYYSRVFQVDTTSYRLIFLDNAYKSTDSSKNRPYLVDRYQLIWLDNQLKASENDVEIIFTHMPLIDGFESDPSKTVEDIDVISAGTVSDLAGVLENNHSTRLIVSGHKHRNLVYNYQFRDNYILPQVETGAFARDANNWRLIQLTADNIIISYPGKSETQYLIPLK